MRFPRVTGSITRPNDNTAYTAGDNIGNSLTGSAVLPISFSMGCVSGKVYGARCSVLPASGNLVIVALDFDLLLFRPDTNIPFAAAGFPADNAALTLTDAMYQSLIGVFPFVNTAWRNPLGALTSSTAGWQALQALPQNSLGYSFNLEGLTPKNTIYGMLQAKGAWTPTGVANTFSFSLDVEPEPDA